MYRSSFANKHGQKIIKWTQYSYRFDWIQTRQENWRKTNLLVAIIWCSLQRHILSLSLCSKWWIPYKFEIQNSNYEIDHFRQGERDIGIFCTLSTGETSNLILIFFARDDWTKWQGEMQDTKRTGRVSCYNIKPIIQMKGFLIVSPACKCLVFEFVSWMLGLSILWLVGRWLCKTRQLS